jgi:hypothetical protein
MDRRWRLRGAIAAVAIAAGPALCAQSPSSPGARAAAVPSAAVRPLTIAVEARALNPGELVRVTITAPADADRIEVSFLDRQFAAFREEPGRWEALVGIDLEARPGRYPMQVTAFAGAVRVSATETLAVLAKTFPTRRLRVAPDYVNPSSPELVARIAAEAAQIAAAYKQSARERLWVGPFVRPVTHEANSAFGTRSVYNGVRRSSHAGADFRSPAGTPIHAPNAGRVALARDLFFTGETVIIDHGLGVFSLLAHLSRIDVIEGQAIGAGDPVGLVGATGRVTGAHLHWGFFVSGARVDPLSALALLGQP